MINMQPLTIHFDGKLPTTEETTSYLIYFLSLVADLPQTSLEFFYPPSPRNVLDDLGLQSVYHPPLPPIGKPGLTKYSTCRFNCQNNEWEQFYVIVNRDESGLLHDSSFGGFDQAVKTSGHCVHSPKIRQSWSHGSLRTLFCSGVEINCGHREWSVSRKTDFWTNVCLRLLTSQEVNEIRKVLGLW